MMHKYGNYSDCLMLSFLRVMGKCRCQNFFLSFRISIRTCHHKLVTMGTDISSLPSAFSARVDPCGMWK